MKPILIYIVMIIEIGQNLKYRKYIKNIYFLYEINIDFISL